MINLDVLEKFSKEELIMIMDSLNGFIFIETIPVKEQIRKELEENKYYNRADLKFNLESFDKLVEKVNSLTELEAIELAKYIEFSFCSNELPLNFSLVASNIKEVFNLNS